MPVITLKICYAQTESIIIGMRKFFIDRHNYHTGTYMASVVKINQRTLYRFMEGKMISKKSLLKIDKNFKKCYNTL